MRRRIACLHSAASNIPHFDRAAEGLALDLRHAVRADLLAAVEAVGGLTPDIVAATGGALRDLTPGADLVLLTCSTLGPTADILTGAVPIRRVDRALAEAAIAAAGQVAGGRVAVLYTLTTTAQPTGDLFRDVAQGTGVGIDLILVDGAWDAFKAGDGQRYADLIAAAADDAAAGGAAAIAFAQASMSPAAMRCRMARPLTSPRASLEIAATR